MDNAIFFRSHDPNDEIMFSVTDGPEYVILTPKYRKPRSGRLNIINIILSQYDYLPKRSKAITFTDLNNAYSFHNDWHYSDNSKMYQVIPQNNIKIAIAPGCDFNKDIPYKFISSFYTYPIDFSVELINIISKIELINTDITIGNFKDKCEEFDTILRGYDIYQDKIGLCGKPIYPSFLKGFYESDKSLYDYFLDVFEPIKAGIKIIDFNWDDMKDQKYRDQFIGKECWIDTKCLLIKRID